MKLAIVALTQAGSALAAKLAPQLTSRGHTCAAFAPARFAAQHELAALDLPISQWAGREFSSSQGLVFICASGIAVRAVAPYVKSKLRDPAVISIDEQGRFVIPLLSGHIGGANALAREIAAMLEAMPVISTSTDLNGVFAVDVWAKQQDLVIADKAFIKDVSAALLEEETVGLASEFPIEGKLPPNVLELFGPSVGICVSFSCSKQPFLRTLHLLPRIVTLGIGCKKDTDPHVLEEAVLSVLQEHQIDLRTVRMAASIDLKANERAILAFCEKYSLPFQTYTAAQLAAVPGQFSSSEFVERVTGVDNVCERAAAADSDRLLIRKRTCGGVTIAAAAKKCTLRFAGKEEVV